MCKKMRNVRVSSDSAVDDAQNPLGTVRRWLLVDEVRRESCQPGEAASLSTMCEESKLLPRSSAG